MKMSKFLVPFSLFDVHKAMEGQLRHGDDHLIGRRLVKRHLKKSYPEPTEPTDEQKKIHFKETETILEEEHKRDYRNKDEAQQEKELVIKKLASLQAQLLKTIKGEKETHPIKVEEETQGPPKRHKGN